MNNSVGSDVLVDRVRGMMLGVLIGDALGMPVETLSRDSIRLLNDGAGVIDYMDPVQHRVTDTKHLQRGDYTDDWQLTSVVADSLSRCRGFDMNDMAKSHITAMQASTFGWGKGSMRSLQELVDGKRGVWDDIMWRKEGQGSGNGVIMKVSPFSVCALGLCLPQNVSEVNILNMSRLTHPDRRAGFSALPVHTFLLEALKHGQAFDMQKVYENAIANVICHEKMGRPYTETVSSHLRGVDTTTIESLIETAGVGFIAWQTAAFTLGVYRRHPKDFSPALLEAVNAGGDTDTNASIVGALVGATVGMSGIDTKWLDIPGAVPAILVADRLCDSFLDK